MMHRDDFVVTLRHGDCDTTFREFRNGDEDSDYRNYRCREVYIPYGSEYRFALKNMKTVRRRIEIAIDGTVIGDWVLDKGSRRIPYEAIIERFADTARKFKVVHPDSPDVADPGSADNGIIVVKVWKEREIRRPLLLYPQSMSRKFKSRGFDAGASAAGGSGDASFLRSADHVLCSDGGSPSFSCSVHHTSHDVVDDGAAATVEGGFSSQQFGTTHWQGDDGSPLVFEFRIVGKGDPTNGEKREGFKVRECVFVRIKLQTIRDCGVTVKNTKIALEQLGFNQTKTKNRGKTLEGVFPEEQVEVIKQLKGVAEVEVL